jgi:hypothetical protein
VDQHGAPLGQRQQVLEGLEVLDQHGEARVVGELHVDFLDARRPQSALGMRHRAAQRELTIDGGDELVKRGAHEPLDGRDASGRPGLSVIDKPG